ncbi:hypothetical protein PYW07_007189 [Mythimna separata]|uniref:C2H2-type domain-containing protein n=1 Tax=Mythimna separata TaxID=271217 RepID=A0AAD7Z2Z1_MYTSE|nr:hypothetical protein PYW07_007189 [Mythimna separata]
MENLNDKLSVKNILFNKVLPNYVIPVPVNGHKLYACTGCGDKFIFESSYNDHINRKSLSITYMCRNCNESRTFYNRCNLLCHIRSHGFKSATINVPDLVIEPLPISDYKIKPSSPTSEDLIPSPIAPSCEVLTANKITTVPQNVSIIVNCFECKENLTSTGAPSKDRACHYMQFSNEIIYSCPICLFALPSICAFKAHLRIHLRCPPYYCPECGLHLSNKNIQYPYNHDCEGFKMMRATARLRCAAPNCRLFHPNDYKEHMKLHMKKVYKCPYCVVACFNAGSMQDHLKSHKSETKPLVFYKCEMCPGKFVMQSRMEWHLKSHKIVCIFPCWPCGAIFKDVTVLLNHFLAKHNPNNSLETALQEIMSENDTNIKDSNKTKRVYRVVKRCDQCQRSFIYRCQYSEIHNLPNECPYKCSSTFGCSTEMDVMPDKTKSNTHITCHICKTNISQDWNEIKKHYAALHKSFKCMDAKIVLTRIDINKYRTKSNTSGIRRTIDMKRRSRRRQNKSLKISVNVGNDRISTHTKKSKIGNGTYNCNICGCGDKYEQKQLLEKHLISHRDPCMAYQCMECGQCFVVKPSFSKHLLLEHNISDIEEYIKEKQCYNENALIKYQSNGDISNEPLRENQCKVCREDFESPEDLAKHFRGHGMAFLMKNNPNKNE